jgi:transposase-like protein
MAREEKDIIDQLLDNIDFCWLTQDEIVGQNGLIKQLTGKILQLALEAEMTENLEFVSYKDFKKLCVALKAVYLANSEEARRDALGSISGRNGMTNSPG